MNIQPTVVLELRRMLKDGATPSKLIRSLVSIHPDDAESLSTLIPQYFEEAFRLPVPEIAKIRDFTAIDHLDLSYLNKDLLHEIIERRHLWDDEAHLDSSLSASSWLDGLSAADHGELIAGTQPELLPPFAAIWNQLDAPAQAMIKRLIGNASGHLQRVAILAKLAERLQQQVDATTPRIAT